MSANILLIEYEPRYIDRVRKALAELGFRLEVAGDLDAAVERCAHFEPQLVILTSVLPRLKIEDAITQLRARAGLRSTPFLILMSGYRGTDPENDAKRYGAQDILERPFAGEVLLQRVERLLSTPASPVATQAIPEDMLEALRRSAGLSEGGASITSDQLFGDILSDVEGDEEERKAPESFTPTAATPPAQAVKPEPKSAPGPAPTVAMPIPPPESTRPDRGTQAEDADARLDKSLEDLLSVDRAAPPPKRTAAPTDTDVDAILSQTLAGLDIQPVRKKAPVAKPVPAKEAERAKAEPKEPPGSEPVKPAAETPPPKPSERAAPPPPKPKKAAPAGVPAEKTPAAAGTQFGQYILQEHIATGGMAEVYRARMMGMEGFQKTVAIKRILPHLTDNDEFVTMFIDEAKLAAQLNHNNIIHIYDLGKIDRSYYIAMEYIEGRDLRSILQDCRERKVIPPIPLSLYMTTLLSSALDYAHRKRDFENQELGLVHRDVSPQNVLISTEGAIKLCDFGIAKAASKASHTRAGALKGKLQYMSPEQAWGKDIDHRSDIFSLGLVLYEMLTGEKVFAGDSELSILEQVRNPKLIPPGQRNPAVTADIDRIIMRALEPDRDRRYQSARDLQRDLELVMRRYAWAPDSADVARFLRELSSGEEISGFAASEMSAASAAPEPVALPAAKVEPVPPKPTPAKPLPPKSAKAEPVVKPEPTARPALPGKPVVLPESVRPEAGVGEDTLSRRSREDKRQQLRLVAGAVALVAVLAVLYVVFGRGGKETPPTPTPIPSPEVVGTGPESPSPTPEALDMIATPAPHVVPTAEAPGAPTPLRPETQPTVVPTVAPTVTAEVATPPVAVPEATQVPTPKPTPTAERVVPTATPVPAPPTPEVREGDLVAGGPGVVPPELIQSPPPKYPPAALRIKAEALVQLQLLVGIDGSVEDVRVLKVDRPNLGFEKESEEAARGWRYKPATKDGVKVRMWVSVRIPFRMSR